MAKVALVLSGCGFLDGAEIHESVLSLLALDEAGHEVVCFAPDRQQTKVVNHLTKQEKKGDVRSCLEEAARIARGAIRPLDELKSSHFDALMLPGGFGAVLNLCDYASIGENCHVLDDLKEAIRSFHREKKPILATCISPVILARVLGGDEPLTMTLGSDPKNAELLTHFGVKGELKECDDACFDEAAKIYTTPCYMEPGSLTELYRGIKKIVARI